MKRFPITEIPALLLILLWTYAGLSKMLVFGTFRDQLSLQPLPAWSIGFFAILLPLTEIFVAIFLLLKTTRFLGMICSFILLTVFSVYVGLATGHFLGKIPCSCGGILGKLGWLPHLFFNLCFMLIAAAGLHFEKRPTSSTVSK